MFVFCIDVACSLLQMSGWMDVYIWKHIHPFGSNLDSIGTVCILFLLLLALDSYLRKVSKEKMRGDFNVRSMNLFELIDTGE